MAIQQLPTGRKLIKAIAEELGVSKVQSASLNMDCEDCVTVDVRIILNSEQLSSIISNLIKVEV